MHILKREARVLTISPFKAALVGIAAIILLSAGTFYGFVLGFDHGRYVGHFEATHTDTRAAEPVVQQGSWRPADAERRCEYNPNNCITVMTTPLVRTGNGNVTFSR